MRKRLLKGKKILLTRSREQGEEMCKKLERLGAEVVEFPTIRIVPPKNYSQLDKAIAKIEDYNWIIFTSQNAIDFFFNRFKMKNKTFKTLKKRKIGVIGPATGKKVKNYGLKVGLLPKRYTTEGIVEEFQTMMPERDKFSRLNILLPRADIATPLLPERLSKLGAKVTQVVAYRTVKEKKCSPKVKKMLKNGKIDFVTFTSSSTVRNFFNLVKRKDIHPVRKDVSSGISNGVHPKIKFVSIGPVTTKTAKELGLKISIQAREHTTDGLIEAILNWTRVNREDKGRSRNSTDFK